MGGGIVLLITLVGLSIIRVTYLPLSFDVVLTAIPFYYFGFVLRERGFLSAESGGSFKNELLRFTATGIAWIALFALIYYFTGTYFQYAPRIYPIGLMSFICAGTGCITVFYFSKMMEKVNFISNIFIWLGRHSLIILCVHYFDDFWEFLWRIGNGLTATILRTLIDLLIVVLLLGVTKKVKKLTGKILR